MPLPIVKCPVCHAAMSLEVLLSDDAPRAALLAIVDIHPQGKTFIKPLLHYIGLFAPAKTQMSHGRIAALITELQPMIAAAQIERNGMTYAAPLDFWIDAIGAVLNARDMGTLTLPLKTHGYLLEVIAKRAQSVSAKEQVKHEDYLRKGEARRSEERERQIQANTARQQEFVSKEEGRQRMAKLTAQYGKKVPTGMSSMNDIAADLLNRKPQGETP